MKFSKVSLKSQYYKNKYDIAIVCKKNKLSYLTLYTPYRFSSIWRLKLVAKSHIIRIRLQCVLYSNLNFDLPRTTVTYTFNITITPYLADILI